MRATKAASLLGLPLNRHVTIHWARAGVAEEAASEATTRYLTLARDWLRKQGQQFAYVYVREGRSGAHVHILMHVPPRFASGFGWRQRGWIRKIAGRRYRRRVVKTRPIGTNTRTPWTAGTHYQANLSKILAYLLKGAAVDVAEAIGLTHTSPQGPVIGKRAGWSENIGAKATSARVAATTPAPAAGPYRVVAKSERLVVDNHRAPASTTVMAISSTYGASGTEIATGREVLPDYSGRQNKERRWLSPLPIVPQPFDVTYFSARYSL